MSSVTFELKRPSGWFAAGREVQQALMLLSDSAFRLFFWLCLHADRKSGSLRISVAALTAALRRTEADIRSALDELLQHRVCSFVQDTVEIADSFWPYHRPAQPEVNDGAAVYIAQVKRCFLQRRCVQSSFTPADEHLAAKLHRSGLSVVDAERAILLGSARKYVSWKNHGIGTRITTLHYFRGVFDELRNTKVPSTYWNYIASTVAQLEQQWDESRFTRFIPEQETK
jgi:hypothetical protein